MSTWGPAEEVDEGVRSGMGQTGKASSHQLKLMPSKLREIRDQAMGSPCYPDEGRFLVMDGRVLLDDPKMPGPGPQAGETGESVPCNHEV